MTAVPDVARIRYDNAMLLFDEFVHATVRQPDATALRGLERRFAERLQIQPSYWSQIKARSRQIGERLARQFEQLCRKPVGWMDVPHGAAPASQAMAGDMAPALQGAGHGGHPPQADATPAAAAAIAAEGDALAPLGRLDDDERFILGLVLSYYRRHPQRARARLLDLLGEVLGTPSSEDRRRASRAAAEAGPRQGAGATPTAGRAGAGQPATAVGASTAASDNDLALWRQLQRGIAPLKPRQR